MSFHSEVLEQSLRKLFAGRYFDICTVNSIGEMLGTEPRQHPDYKYLSALHCVHYSDMSATVRDELPGRVAAVLRPGFDINAAAMAFALTAEGRGFAPIGDAPTPRRLRLFSKH